MPVDAKTRGLQMLETLYPDPTVRAARAEELGDAGITTLGSHGLRQDDYSRHMNELAGQRAAVEAREKEATELYDSNKAWFDQKEKDLQELDRLRKQVGSGGGNGNNPPANPDPNAPKVVTAEDLAATERGAVAFFTELQALTLQHFQQFGEVLDTQQLLQDKRVQQIGLRGVYGDLHKDKITARAEAAKKAEEDKIRADERQKVLAEGARSHHPYPVRGNEPSTLDALETPGTNRPAVRTVDEMAAEYARLSAARTGAPA